MNSLVDDYIAGSTKWPAEMRQLRSAMLGAGLTEGIKWGKPCFSHDGANIAIFQEMRDFLSLMFFKGALLSDPDTILESQGPNSRSARRICFRSVDDVDRLSPAVTRYVANAIAVEQAGLELPKAPSLVLVDELRERLASDADLSAAFDRLTPGRQREYHLHISGAKQRTTRESRIDKVAPRILEGRGLRDR